MQVTDSYVCLLIANLCMDTIRIQIVTPLCQEYNYVVVVVLHKYSNCLVSVYNNYVVNNSSGGATVYPFQKTHALHIV